MVAALHSADRTRPYTHQATAVAAAMQERNVVLSTSTASGKSLCFQVPILQAALDEPRSRALMLFPTKALGRDQVESLRGLASHLEGAAIGVGVYDGDTPPDERRAARRRAHAIATNPDMLHRGILPHHDRWASFLAGLRLVVLDELHTYRGLFGSHVANVLRRLFRVCRHHGSAPTVVACSATIANPAELAEGLCGQPFELVDANTAPTGGRAFAVLNPRVVDETTGVRRDYLKVTRSVTTQLRRAGVQTLAFCRTRKAVELLTRYMREDEQREADAGSGGNPSAIRGYRGGYLPERRREVEKALREGEARVVASTNALELGIDIGGVDAVVLSGYPGTRAATVQRAGRAGRRGRAALTVLCLSSAPLDQFVAADPAFLWGKPPEHARVDPDNPEVLLPHLRCAAFELAFGPGRGLPGVSDTDLRAGLDYLADEGGLYRDEDEDGDGAVYAAAGADSPAEQVDLRGSVEENFSVLDEPSGDVLAQVDFEDAPLYLHPGAIYAVEGRTHEVRVLDWDARKAFVRRTNADYYTEAVVKTRVRVIEAEAEPDADATGVAQPPTGHGMAHIVRTVPGFKKIRFGTHENIGFGPVSLPDLELHTAAAYWRVPPLRDDDAGDPMERASTALSAAHALHHVAAMLLMCDVGDLGHVVTAGHPSAWGPVISGRASAEALIQAQALPYVVLFDKQPGGAGLATTAFAMGAALFERVAAVVSGCGCDRGCPTCMGAGSDDAWEADRGAVVELLRALAGAAEPGVPTCAGADGPPP